MYQILALNLFYIPDLPRRVKWKQISDPIKALEDGKAISATAALNNQQPIFAQRKIKEKSILRHINSLTITRNCSRF